jgi:hypothetical protein
MRLRLVRASWIKHQTTDSAKRASETASKHFDFKRAWTGDQNNDLQHIQELLMCKPILYFR